MITRKAKRNYQRKECKINLVDDRPDEEKELDRFFYGHYAGNIRKHYVHAREKHPYFCDRLTLHDKSSADRDLQICRNILKEAIALGHVLPCYMLDCEWAEAIQAMTNGDTARAVEECYDTIAVLLRTIDVLEGRQRLGK